MDEKPFFGREKLVREIVQGVLAADPMDFALVAPKFCGKTRILTYLADENGPLKHPAYASWRPERFRDHDRVVALLIDCNWPQAQEDLLGYMAQRLKEHLEREQPFSVDWSEMPGEDIPSHLLLALAQRANEQDYRIVFLLNNFDTVLEKKSLHPKLNELRPLTPELALVVGAKRPLHDIDPDLTVSPLLYVLRPLFVGLLEREAALTWIHSYRESFPGLAEELVEPLLEITGHHPFLLARLRETLLEVEKMLPAGQRLTMADFELIKLRLAEHGRLLFETLHRTLKDPPPPLTTDSVKDLLARLMEGPIAQAELTPEQKPTMNWLINQTTVTYDEREYRLFTPLFADFLRQRAPQPDSKERPQTTAKVASSLPPTGRTLPRIESELLSYLARHANRVVSPQELLVQVWRLPADSSERRVQEAIRRLRNHLKMQTPPIGVIENERGQGYRFIPVQEPEK